MFLGAVGIYALIGVVVAICVILYVFAKKVKQLAEIKKAPVWGFFILLYQLMPALLCAIAAIGFLLENHIRLI